MSVINVQIPDSWVNGSPVQLSDPRTNQLVSIMPPAGTKPGATIAVQLPALAAAAAPVYTAGGQVIVQEQKMSSGGPGNTANLQPLTGTASLGQFADLFISQTRRGWLAECFGCEQNSEFLIASPAHGGRSNTIMYALEDATCMCRFCFGSLRESKMDVRVGTHEQDQGGKIMSYDRPFRCGPGNLKCCCYQEMNMFNDSDQPIGTVKETCWYCIPEYHVIDEKEQTQYRLHMPSCCGGACVDCFAEGCCNCRIPFYVYPAEKDGNDEGKQLQGLNIENDPKKGINGKKNSQITKIWSGGMNELFTDADKFEVEFPAGASANNKALLLGSVFFVNMLYFEAKGNK